MTTPRTMKLRLGLVVLLTLALLAGMVVVFGSFPSLFRRTTAYTVRFTDAPGLAPGAPVRRSGVKIGTVKSIALDEDRGIVRVVIAIDEPFTVRKSERPTLTAGLLGSDVGIDLLPIDPDDKEVVDRTPFEPGAELRGERASSVNTLIRGASEVVPTTQQTLNELRKSVQRIEKFVARAEKTIPEAEETLKVYRDLGTDARKQLPEFEKSNKEFQKTNQEFQKTNQEIQKTNANLQKLVRQSEEIVPEVQRTAEEARALTRDLRAGLPEVMKTNKQVGDAARAIVELVPSVERTLDEYRGLAVDARKMLPAVRENLDDFGAASRNVARLTERADVMLQTNQPKIEKAIDSLNDVLARAGEFASDKNVKNATRALENAAKASDDLPGLSKSADELMKQGMTTLKRLDETMRKVDAAVTDAQRALRPFGDRSERIVTNADESVQRLNAILSDVQKRSPRIAQNVDETAARANQMSVVANEILTDVRSLLRAIDKADGSFRKFITDPSLYNTVDATAASVLRLLPRVDRILKDFETFADKLARHPEAIGVGGVLNPSSGLKAPATPPIGPRKGP